MRISDWSSDVCSSDLAKFAVEHMANAKMRRYATSLARYAAEWNVLTMRIMLMARKDRDQVSAASHHFLMYSGYVTMAYFWGLQAAVASGKLAKGGSESPEFYKAKQIGRASCRERVCQYV